MKKTISTTIGILIVVLVAGIAGASVLFFGKEKELFETDEIVEKSSVELEKEVVEGQNYYENKVYGYKIEIPASFEYKLQHSGEIIKENNFLEKNKYGHHNLIIGIKMNEKYEYMDGQKFAIISLPIKVDDFRQYYGEKGYYEGISSDKVPYPPANSVDEWINHYKMGRNWLIHGSDWECNKKLIDGNMVAVCKRENLAPYALFWELSEYFFITKKGGFILQSIITNEFGPEPNFETPYDGTIKLEEETKWVYKEIEKMISSFQFLD
jgi:hypothetical protein